MLRIRIPKITEKVDRREWDFSVIPKEEERASCYYEYARESSYIVNRLDESPTVNAADPRERALDNNPLVCALPLRYHGQQYFDGPWLAKPPEWRGPFCERLAEVWEGLSYARLSEATLDRAFVVGISLPFPWQKWTEQNTRLLDSETGLELLLVTIDWSNFDDGEIIERFSRWIKSPEGRPKGVGLRDRRGKRQDTWRKKLERLALLRMRNHYSLDEMASLLPPAWDKRKFTDEREIRRARKAAKQTLLELFPFLSKDTKPKSWLPA